MRRQFVFEFREASMAYKIESGHFGLLSSCGLFTWIGRILSNHDAVVHDPPCDLLRLFLRCRCEKGGDSALWAVS